MRFPLSSFLLILATTSLISASPQPDLDLTLALSSLSLRDLHTLHSLTSRSFPNTLLDRSLSSTLSLARRGPKGGGGGGGKGGSKKGKKEKGDKDAPDPLAMQGTPEQKFVGAIGWLSYGLGFGSRKIA